MNQTLPSPYKGLMPYAKEDEPFFFGRERERELITANLMASRLTLLYGPSGVGKSSVINAGVVWYLEEQARANLSSRREIESLVVAFSTWRDDPVGELKQRITIAMHELLPNLELPANRELSLADFLQQSNEVVGTEILVILDQFEEYFLYHRGGVDDTSFAAQLAQAVNRPGLRANFLISIREDGLAKLDLFKGQIPNLFDTYLRIEHLDRDAARHAIEKPVDEFNKRVHREQPIRVEPALVDAVLDQVTVGQVLWTGSGRGVFENPSKSAQIETPYLQLVMTRLWNEEMDAQSSVLRVETLTRLGGASKIVSSHLDKTMSALSPLEQETAAQIFRYLVTPSGSKIALTASDLANYTDLPEAQLNAILQRLSHDVRILRPITPPAGIETATRYEIFHDVLATPILDWQTRSVYSREMAATTRSLKGLILPCVLGVIADTFLCMFPSGSLLVWLLLRRRKFALKRELVNAIALGWTVGWGAGMLLYFALYIVFLVLQLADKDFGSARGEDLFFAAFLAIFIVVRIFGPIGSLIAVARWRRKTRSKYASRSRTITLSSPA